VRKEKVATISPKSPTDKWGENLKTGKRSEKDNWTGRKEVSAQPRHYLQKKEGKRAPKKKREEKANRFAGKGREPLCFS